MCQTEAIDPRIEREVSIPPPTTRVAAPALVAAIKEPVRQQIGASTGGVALDGAPKKTDDPKTPLPESKSVSEKPVVAIASQAKVAVEKAAAPKEAAGKKVTKAPTITTKQTRGAISQWLRGKHAVGDDVLKAQKLEEDFKGFLGCGKAKKKDVRALLESMEIDLPDFLK